eukprot:NODE_6829_length_839_cov_17.867318_g6230_i0.p1 GENE.NODE_6829_length_839_cov_17.867318_g6230_i0~~NODE_6829_length_839_cov_17.867318_g6230_i0.p1  ORF type:complete len:250 (+),score=47.92 NODE_6829_length_839_cov_17.867318_g6230_i0:59-751(+)
MEYWANCGEDARNVYNKYVTGTVKVAFNALARSVVDLPRTTKTLDFGCGGGRSTVFLYSLGFTDIEGVDTDELQIKLAKETHPNILFTHIEDSNLNHIADGSVGLVTLMLVFLNSESLDKMISNLKEIKRVLSPNGKIVAIMGSEKYYTQNWSTYTLVQGPTGSGSRVRVNLNGTDLIFSDVYWSEEDRMKAFVESGLKIHNVDHPLASPNDNLEPETINPPWTIFELTH